jgi:hypothetical protein
MKTLLILTICLAMQGCTAEFWQTYRDEMQWRRNAWDGAASYALTVEHCKESPKVQQYTFDNTRAIATMQCLEHYGW